MAQRNQARTDLKALLLLVKFNNIGEWSKCQWRIQARTGFTQQQMSYAPYWPVRYYMPTGTTVERRLEWQNLTVFCDLNF